MKPYKELFEQYKKGILPDDKIIGLNKMLIEIYFSTSGDMDESELEYTEDLIIELYAGNKLTEKYARKFYDKLNKDKTLFKKYKLFRDLSDSTGQARNERSQHLIWEGITDEKEEEELEEVLREVIGRIYAEKEKTVEEPVMARLITKLKAFFEDLIPPINFAQPQVRLIMVAVSVVVLAVVVWVSVNPGKEGQMANNEVSDTMQNKQIADIDSVIVPEDNEKEQLAENEKKDKDKEIQLAEKEKKEWELKELAKREQLSNLIADNYEKPKFEHTLMRNQSSNANDLFIRAGKNYEQEDYDSCIFILNDLLKSKAFKTADTLNEIYFYLGNSYFNKGLTDNKKKDFDSALASFNKVKAKYLIREAKWYTALTYLNLNRNKEAKQLIDTLIQINYPRNIKAFNDSVEAVLGD